MKRLLAIPIALLLSSCALAPEASVTPTSSDNLTGNENAKVTLVEYGDYQCPACATINPNVESIVNKYENEILFSFRHFPLESIHNNALPAAEAAESAGAQGKFWEMHNMLYEKQSEWSDAPDATDIFVGYATELGLDASKFRDDLTSHKFKEKVRIQYQKGFSLGVNATPTFFLNGKKLASTPRSYAEFQAIIDKALKESSEASDSPIMNNNADSSMPATASETPSAMEAEESNTDANAMPAADDPSTAETTVTTETSVMVDSEAPADGVDGMTDSEKTE